MHSGSAVDAAFAKGQQGGERSGVFMSVASIIVLCRSEVRIQVLGVNLVGAGASKSVATLC